jgi:MFS family permease
MAAMNLVALKSPPFRSYLVSMSVALHGLWAQRVIVGWLAWELTGSAAFVGIVAFLNFIPTVIGSPFFGVIADRIDLRRASIIAYALVGTISAIFSIIAFADGLIPLVVAGFSLATGIIASANHPIRMSLTPRLAPVEHLSSVIALTALNFNLSRLVGPAIGGGLIQIIGAPSALMVTAVGYLPAVLVLPFVRPRERTNEGRKDDEGYLAALLDGWRQALNKRIIRLGMLLSGLCAITGRSVLETLPILADGVFEKGPAGLGLMTAVAGGGALCASLFKALSVAQQPNAVPQHALVMALATPILVTSLAAVDHFFAALGITMFLGFSVTLVAVSLQSLVQMEISDVYRGRVMGLWIMVSIGGGAAGAIIMGGVSDALGVTSAQVTIGLTALALCGVVVSLLNRATTDSA